MYFHGLHTHDVRDLASVAGLVVLRSGDERIHVLADAWASAMGCCDLLVVPVPDNFRLRISAAWSTGELHILTALHSLTLGIPLYVRWTRWICKTDAAVAPLYRSVVLTKLIWKYNPDNWDRKSFSTQMTQNDVHGCTWKIWKELYIYLRPQYRAFKFCTYIWRIVIHSEDYIA